MFLTWEICLSPTPLSLGPTRNLESGWLSRLRTARMPHLPYHVEFFLSKRLIPEYVPLVLVPGATCIYRKENTMRVRPYVDCVIGSPGDY